MITYECSTLNEREKYIGLDVHQATISVAVMDSQGKVVIESILETKARGTVSESDKEGFAGMPSAWVTARPGISYMLSPIQRLYGGPESKETLTVNMPHFMFYAPNLTSKDIGGGAALDRYPYLVNPGPHAYIIVNVGEKEKAQINQEEGSLLKHLCAFRTDYCLSGQIPERALGKSSPK